MCDGEVYVKISHLTNGHCSFPVVNVKCIFFCGAEGKGKETKATGETTNERRDESEEMSVSERKADSYRWSSHLLASLPRTGSDLERHTGRGRTP